MRSRASLVRILCHLAISIAVVIGGPPCVRAQQPEEQDSFYSFGTKVPLRVALSRIGVLAREGVDEGRIKEFAATLQLHLVQGYPGRIYVLGMQRPVDRAQVVKLAREVSRRGEKLIVQAGLVVTAGGPADPNTAAGAPAPMLVTDQIIVQLVPGAKREAFDALNRRQGVQVIMENPFVRNQFLARATEVSTLDAIRLSNLYEEQRELVQFAHPNFIKVVIERESILNDTYFANQWHHRNTGASGGTVDADSDTSWAWDITQGAAGTIISVIDSGFDMTHPDLTPNFWLNPGEVSNGVDDADPNPYIDDLNGWDFTGCDVSSPPANCGDNDPTGGNHGTSVAGVAAARGNNATGISGTCPNCRMMLIRLPNSDFAQGLAFGYAQQMGGQIITNSWGLAIGTPCTTNLCTAINTAATAGRGGLGSVVFFAMNNPNVNDCIGSSPDISSLANVVAVSRSSNRDRFDFSGFGNCMDILAPSGAGGTGTLWIASTDRQGTAGYNNTAPFTSCPSTEPAPPPTNARDYTFCFNGTSAATPEAAGIGGLVLTARPGLTRLQVQQLVQDTADKVEDSTGSYSPATGFSSPTTGHATHGYGRINAFEAVRVAAPSLQGGREGVDVFLRDNRLDWGNTEQPSNTLFEPTRGYIGHWQSMDVKVDAPPYGTSPTAATFDAFVDETPSAVMGDLTRVFVRVRNRGPVTASTVNVKLHWAQFGTALPPLPTDFWSSFPANSSNTTQWHPLDCSTPPPAPLAPTVCQITNLAYSGASVAGTTADAAQVVQFSFPAPPVDPMLANHFCMLALIDSTQDPISAASKASTVVDDITPTDNNVTHRNYSNLPTGASSRFRDAFLVRNPLPRPIRSVLRVRTPQGWRFEAEPYDFDKPFNLEPGEEVLVTVQAAAPAPGLSADVPIHQELLEEKGKVLGGLTLAFAPGIGPAPSPPISALVTPYLIGTYDLRNHGRAYLHVLNPTSRELRVLVAFFDQDERPQKCLRNRLTANDLWEIDVRSQEPGAELGVVKILALDPQSDVPQLGIVGTQRTLLKGKRLAETGLHQVPEEILRGDLDLILKACR